MTKTIEEIVGYAAQEGANLGIKRAIIAILQVLEPKQRIEILYELVDMYDSEMEIFGRSK